MPRGPRAIHPGVWYHVINRGNHRRRLFHRSADYAAFVALIQKVRDLVPIELFAVCLMPNHFHVVLRATERDAVGRWALLTDPPVPLPGDWEELVEAPLNPVEVEQLRSCVNRQQPYGSDAWIDGSQECTGFHRARPRGRPPCRK